MDELKKLTHPYSEAEDDDFDDFDDETLEDASPAPAPRRSFGRADSAARSTAKVVNINATTKLQVVLVKPDRFDLVSEIADHLREKQAVVLNLESTNKDVARRLVDFLSGCAYALDGKIKKVAISTYLITPYNVDVVGDLVEELENSGMYF
jgi:cell division inhibitor SepF